MSMIDWTAEKLGNDAARTRHIAKTIFGEDAPAFLEKITDEEMAQGFWTAILELGLYVRGAKVTYDESKKVFSVRVSTGSDRLTEVAKAAGGKFDSRTGWPLPKTPLKTILEICAGFNNFNKHDQDEADMNAKSRANGFVSRWNKEA